MVERIGDDGVLLPEQRLEDAPVGVEAGSIEDRILRTEVVRNGLFELLVNILAAADEAYGGHAEAPLVHRAFGGTDQTRVVRKPEVIVGAEIEHLPAADLNGGALGRSDDPFGLVKAGSLDFGELPLQVLLNFTVHIVNSFKGFPVINIELLAKVRNF